MMVRCDVRDAWLARVPSDAAETTLSATLVLDPMGWLSVEIAFLGVPVDRLEVQFFALGEGGQAMPLTERPGETVQGRARLDFPVPVGAYLCQIERQKPARIVTVEDPDKPYLLALPIGRAALDQYPRPSSPGGVTR